MPLPSADHEEPFHRAMLLALTPPAEKKLPAATRLPFGSTANAVTGPTEPRLDHVAPFQRAMPSAAAPPALEKLPPTTRSPFGSTARA